MNAIKAKDPVKCCPRSVMLYADGELAPSHTIEVEAHLKDCVECNSQLELVRSMRASLRRSCARSAPRAFSSKMQTVLDQVGACSSAGHAVEARPISAGDAPPANDARARRWALVGAVAVAACFVIVVMRSEQRKATPMHRTLGSTIAAANDEKGGGLDALVDELVSQHANPLPPEEKNPEDLTRLEPYVGVPVRRPALALFKNLKVENGRFDGARIHRVLDSKNAAALQYYLKGHRLTIYVFDPNKIPISRTRLRTRVVEPAPAGTPCKDHPETCPGSVANGPIYVGNVRGFSVAAAEREGVGYALASDLDEDKSVQMVASF